MIGAAWKALTDFALSRPRTIAAGLAGVLAFSAGVWFEDLLEAQKRLALSEQIVALETARANANGETVAAQGDLLSRHLDALEAAATRQAGRSDLLSAFLREDINADADACRHDADSVERLRQLRRDFDRLRNADGAAPGD